MTLPFNYPSLPHFRRHDPRGYAGHESYRSWVRDEFAFRCAFCLRREVMGQECGEFAIDHFLPVSYHPDLVTEYPNLLYVCTRCNLRKMQQFVADPLIHLLTDAVLVHQDGLLETRSRESRQIVRVVRLNDPDLIAYRRMWMRIVETTRCSDPVLYRQILAFPADLPDLRKLQPPGGNTKPEGIEQSYLCQRERGELPETY